MDFVIYAICFGVGLVFTLVSFFLGHDFGGADGADVGTGGHAETGLDHSGMPGISIFSPTTIACFLTALGGFGMVFSVVEATSAIWISAPLAILGGTAVAAVVMWGFTVIFRKTQASSESKVASLAGRPATVISPIPEGGVGEIAYVDGGSRYNTPARAEGGVAVPSGTKVYITRVVGTQFYVSPQ